MKFDTKAIIIEAIHEALDRELANYIEDKVCERIDIDEITDVLLEDFDLTNLALDMLG